MATVTITINVEAGAGVSAKSVRDSKIYVTDGLLNFNGFSGPSGFVGQFTYNPPSGLAQVRISWFVRAPDCYIEAGIHNSLLDKNITVTLRKRGTPYP